MTERQLPVARFSLWAHLRALAEEGRARASGRAGGGGHHRDHLGRRLRGAGSRPVRRRRGVSLRHGGLDPLEHSGRAALGLDERGHFLAHDPGQLGEDGAELAVLGQGHRDPGVAGGGQVGVQRDGADQRHAQARGPGAAPPPEPKRA